MFKPETHIIVIDGEPATGKNMLCFELSLILLYNAQRTAIVVDVDSPLRETIKKRIQAIPQLLTPTLLTRSEFYNEANKYQAILIPKINAQDELSIMASTYITLLPKGKVALQRFQKKREYFNALFELKKKIAATYNHSLNWVVCENNFKPQIINQPSAELEKIAHLYGFRVSPPLNHRKPYKNNVTGISAQDKSLPILQKNLTYDDICAKREIVKLAEFIFN
ncbi:hypothetical protein IJ556_07730 [bacterium]|nr:hypothetical protein [bacterium]MBR2274345.1 hypothetical protein [Alphaproteobacteria bacterium]